MNDGMLLGLLGGFAACVGVPALFALVFIKLRNGQRELNQAAADVRSEAIAELLPWGPASLSELTREWVGASTYTWHGDRASGSVPSGRAPTGWLLVFTMDLRHDGADGVVKATTSAHQLELRVSTGVCEALVNGARLGTFRLGHAELFAADETPAGTYRREPPVARLVLREREVATLDTRTTGAANRAELPTLLFTHLAVRSSEEELWALIAAVLELAWFGPRLAHQPARVSSRRV